MRKPIIQNVVHTGDRHEYRRDHAVSSALLVSRSADPLFQADRRNASYIKVNRNDEIISTRKLSHGIILDSPQSFRRRKNMREILESENNKVFSTLVGEKGPRIPGFKGCFQVISSTP